MTELLKPALEVLEEVVKNPIDRKKFVLLVLLGIGLICIACVKYMPEVEIKITEVTQYNVEVEGKTEKYIRITEIKTKKDK